MLVHGNNEQKQVIDAGQSFFIPWSSFPALFYTQMYNICTTQEKWSVGKKKETNGLERLEECGREQRRKGLTMKVHEGLWWSQIICLHSGMPKSCAASKM